MSIELVDLFRYPVKSMQGEQLSRSHIGVSGLPGDRAWAVRDEERGGIRGAKRFPELMACAARYPDEPAPDGVSPAIITLPDGKTLKTSDEDIAHHLSETVGSPVTLWPLMPKEAVEHYRRGAPMLDDMEAELRRMFARLPEEPLPDLSVFPPELLEFESPVGTYFDAFPLLIMSKQSLAHMAEQFPDNQWDIRRFRPNLLLDVEGEAGSPEFDWEGRQLQIGELVLQLEIICPRCVMTTHGFADLSRDPGVMRSLVQGAQGALGIYASIVTPGEVAVGDKVTLR